ncbi:MAG TPA: flagellar biosynthesis protein FlhF [Rhodanobacteraceae bacterium]|nr:flagellar biosynthesis protein FlhF [Rhodanobacteraceae bacterium]
MKIKRFVAAGMRQAMQQVRDEQGPDAVILSTRRLDEGIEIIAAIDYDEALVREAAVHAMPGTTASAPSAGEAAARPARTNKPDLQDLLAQLTRPVAGAPESSPLISDMRQELGSLREMLETQLASLAWNDMDRRHPMHASVLRQLTRMDIDPDIARAVADDLPSELSSEQARYLPLGLISQRVASGGRQLSNLEGVTAMVGPTGVGKTTTVAKLAAHAVLHYGVDQVALVSTDHYRIGGGAQLGQYARLLGVPVYEVHEASELCSLLVRLRDRRAILVDSAGMGAHDPQLVGQLDILRAAQPCMCATLVLAANAQAQAMDDAARAYLPLRPRGCVLTKLDEAPRLGGALSVLLRYRLALDFTTDGQRVPEDIAAADVRRLVCRAAARSNPAGPPSPDMVMAERFGRAAYATA